MSELNNKPFKTKCNKVKHDWQDENGKLARRARKRICGCKLVGEKGIAWMVRIRITKNSDTRCSLLRPALAQIVITSSWRT